MGNMTTLSDVEYWNKLSNKKHFGQIIFALYNFSTVKPLEDDIEFKRKQAKFLKFCHVEFCYLLIASKDLLEDTDDAIQYCLSKGLGKELGQQYLKLYGLLNAVYMQSNSIKNLLTIFDWRDDKYKQTLSQLAIIEIRNKIIHSGEYVIDITKRKSITNLDFYRLSQSTLSANGRYINLVSMRGEFKEFDINQLLIDYNQVTDTILFQLCEHLVNVRCCDAYKDKNWFQERLSFLRSHQNLGGKLFN